MPEQQLVTVVRQVPTWGHVYWPVGLLTASLMFLIPEAIAFFTNKANTLSAYSWGELEVHRATRLWLHIPAWYVSLAAWLLFFIVITGHIWFKSETAPFMWVWRLLHGHAP